MAIRDICQYIKFGRYIIRICIIRETIIQFVSFGQIYNTFFLTIFGFRFSIFCLDIAVYNIIKHAEVISAAIFFLTFVEKALNTLYTRLYTWQYKVLLVSLNIFWYQYIFKIIYIRLYTYILLKIILYSI